MTTSIEMQWDGGLRFQGTNAWGNTIVADAAREAGGNESGIKPTELLLYGVASCTGVDIVRILEKRRQKLTSLTIRVEADQNEDYPKPFHTVRVHYVAKGEDLDPKALAKAIELSEGKYCVVSQTLQEPAEITTSYEIVD
jgi:putative redox protein